MKGISCSMTSSLHTTPASIYKKGWYKKQLEEEGCLIHACKGTMHPSTDRIYTHARAGGALIIAAPAPFGRADESVADETECTRVRPLRKTYHGS